MKKGARLTFTDLHAILVVLALCSSTNLRSQTPSTTITAEDAVAFLTKGGELSNLQVDSTQPFHLVAKIETFDYTGQPDGTATVEEFWDGSRMRRSITYRGATQIEVLAVQTYVSSEAFTSSWQLRTLLQGLLNPMPHNPKLPNLVAEGKKLKLGGVDADCIAVAFRSPSAKSPAIPPSIPINYDTYCLSADRHLLRLANTSNGATLIYNNLETFGPKAVAHDITLNDYRLKAGRLGCD